jgi:hypothetical protein
MLAFGLVLVVAAVFVVREAGRIAKAPPPALFDPDDAYEYVVRLLTDEVAATLTPADVRRILGFEVEFLEGKRVAGNGSGADSGSTVFGGTETVSYIVQRSAATGEVYLPEQVQAVLDTQLDYLRGIGAIGPPDEIPGESAPT